MAVRQASQSTYPAPTPSRDTVARRVRANHLVHTFKTGPRARPPPPPSLSLSTHFPAPYTQRVARTRARPTHDTHSLTTSHTSSATQPQPAHTNSTHVRLFPSPARQTHTHTRHTSRSPSAARDSPSPGHRRGAHFPRGSHLTSSRRRTYTPIHQTSSNHHRRDESPQHATHPDLRLANGAQGQSNVHQRVPQQFQVMARHNLYNILPEASDAGGAAAAAAVSSPRGCSMAWC